MATYRNGTRNTELCTSPDDLAGHSEMPEDVRAELLDEFGLRAIKARDGQELLIIDAGEGYCLTCADPLEPEEGDVESGYIVYDLIIPDDPADGVEWTEGERVCEQCGNWLSHNSLEEADESARWDAGELQYEQRKDEGWYY